jgi:hypothetical protein
MTDWQPIATAPRDESYILIHQTGVLEPSQYVACFDPSWGDDGWWLVCDGKDPELALRGPEPTHWMPLPEAPK